MEEVPRNGRVVLASSSCPQHPADGILSDHEGSYWMSCGLYPQELVYELPEITRGETFKIVASGVKNLKVEGCSDDVPVNFDAPLLEEELPRASTLQKHEFRVKAAGAVRFVRILIQSGYHDFCSIHKVRLD